MLSVIEKTGVAYARRHAGAELIELTILYERSRMRIMVKDNGRGIDPVVDVSR
jgi:signal transduction histidine kinase